MRLSQLLLEQNHADHSDSIMVCFWIPEDVARQLVQPEGEEIDQLHITLAYLGKCAEYDDDTISAIQDACADCAESSKALTGKINGIGRFEATEHSDGKEVIYAKPLMPGIMILRNHLVQQLKRAGANVRENFEYHPHITLAYVDPGDQTEPELDNIKLQFSELSLVVGGESYNYPLAGGSHETNSNARRATAQSSSSAR